MLHRRAARTSTGAARCAAPSAPPNPLPYECWLARERKKCAPARPRKRWQRRQVSLSCSADGEALRLCYLIESLGAGGAERSLVELLPRFRESGVETTVCCLKRSPEGFEPDARLSGVEILCLEEGSWWGKIRLLRRILRERRVQILHTTLFYADLAGRLAAMGSRVHVLTSLVNTTYDRARLSDPNVNTTRLRLVQAMDAASARLLTDHFHAITEAVKRSAVRSLAIPARRITVVERGRSRERLGEPDPERRLEARVQLGIAPDAEIVLNVGRQEFQKGQSQLMEAAAILLQERPQLTVLIAGREGHATADLGRRAEELQLGERLRFLGHRSDVPELLAAADVFVFPSLYEGLGGALIEAMALELPVVASNIPALTEVVDDGVTGIVTEPGDAEGLASSVRRLLDDQALRTRLGTAARKRFDERFSLERSAARMVELYRSICASPRALATEPGNTE